MGHNDNYTHQTYVIPTEPASEVASRCPDNSNKTRCLTLNELIVSVPKRRSVFQSKEEVIFQPGVHIVNGTERTYLLAFRTRKLLMRGETNNVTIICWEEFNFAFVQAAHVIVSNLTLHNCSMNGGMRYSRVLYCCKHTFLFIGLEGNVILDSIQITSDSNRSIAVHLKGDSTTLHASVHVQLTNLRLSTGILIAPYNIYIARRSVIEITNSSFSDSCIEIQGSSGLYSELDIMIKNTSFKSCSSCWSVLIFRGANRRFSVTLHNVNVSDSRSPYVMYADQTTIHFQGNFNLFHHNRGVTYMVRSELLFSTTKVEFINNMVNNTQGVPVYADDSVLVFNNSHVVFKNNHGSVCGGIIGTEKATLLFRDNSTVDFEDNEGQKGGALSLYKQSVLRFNTSVSNLKTELHFTSNEAQNGGAVFVKDKDYISIIDQKLRVSVFDGHNTDAKLKFSNNLAQIGGNQIYGGWVDWFVGEDGVARYNPNISRTLEFEGDKDISSDPVRVCMCINKIINCSIIEHQRDIYGQAFSIDLVAVGQRYGTVISFVEARLKEKTGNQMRGEVSIGKRQKVQIVQRDCTPLRYTMNSVASEGEETLIIVPLKRENSPRFDPDQLQEHPDHDILFQQFSVKLKIRDCPIGFMLHEADRHCACRQSLLNHHLSCNLNDYQINRSGQQWVGVTYQHTTVYEHPGVIVHQHCPFDYCRTDNESLSIRLEDQDEQCAFNRTGILCGGCKAGFSNCLLYTSPSPRDATLSRMPSSA